jgi:16S rRNA (uracil1498-N3)-methyltransferase
MRYFFIQPHHLAQDVLAIEGEEARHMGKVLRLKPGMMVGLSDGRGMQADGRILTKTRDRVEVEVLRRYPSPREPEGELVVAQAMLKDQKMDLVLRQLTELGISGWLPFVSSRSVPQPDPQRQASRMSRWERIAREAVKQCRRGRVPDIVPVGKMDDILGRCGHFDAGIMFWEGARDPLELKTADDASDFRRLLLLVGPEGGFSEGEAAAAEQAGFKLATLGPRILRAETASVVACALVQHLYGDLRHTPPQEDHGGFQND